MVHHGKRHQERGCISACPGRCVHAWRFLGATVVGSCRARREWRRQIDQDDIRYCDIHAGQWHVVQNSWVTDVGIHTHITFEERRVSHGR